ncbi:MAG: DUF5018 domain-containing protein [Bacteroidales bacterium]|nr:DUF5018 domain-containing protein [Bacteroidales bacterium]
MKVFKYILVAVLGAAVAASCVKVGEYDFLHDDCTIHSIYCTPVSAPVSTQISGIIDNEAGTIEFAIPRDKYQKYYKLDSLKIRANIGYDATVTPSFSSRVWDLNEDREFTVTANMTGKTKKYTVSAYKTK